MSTAPRANCPTCGGWLRLGEGHGPFRNFCSSDCIRHGRAIAPSVPRTPHRGPIPGMDPLEAHYGPHDEPPMIPVEQWPIAVGDLVADAEGRRGQVTLCRWASKYRDRDAVWESWVEVVPGRVGETSLGRDRHARPIIYRATDLVVVTRWADLDA